MSVLVRGCIWESAAEDEPSGRSWDAIGGSWMRILTCRVEVDSSGLRKVRLYT